MGATGILLTGSQSSKILYCSSPFYSFNSFNQAICTLLYRLLSYLGQSVPSYKDYVPRLGEAQEPYQTPILSSSVPSSKDYFP